MIVDYSKSAQILNSVREMELSAIRQTMFDAYKVESMGFPIFGKAFRGMARKNMVNASMLANRLWDIGAVPCSTVHEYVREVRFPDIFAENARRWEANIEYYNDFSHELREVDCVSCFMMDGLLITANSHYQYFDRIASIFANGYGSQAIAQAMDLNYNLGKCWQNKGFTCGNDEG